VPGTEVGVEAGGAGTIGVVSAGGATAVGVLTGGAASVGVVGTAGGAASVVVGVVATAGGTAEALQSAVTVTVTSQLLAKLQRARRKTVNLPEPTVTVSVAAKRATSSASLRTFIAEALATIDLEC
jgi:hypothetical protein